jgi:hypothetical protein
MSNIDFAEFVTDLDNGRVNQQLGTELQKLVSAVEETGLTGSMTIKLTLTKEGAMAVVDVDSQAKIPHPPHHSSLFYVDANNGTLHKDNPRQLKLKTVPESKKVVDMSSRKAGDDTEKGE